jgi:hypothetical protein
MVNIDKMVSDDTYFEEVKPNIWLMDNHRWAYYIWELYAHRNPGKLPSTLIHVDYHWDDINDFSEQSAIDELKRGDINHLHGLVKQNKSPIKCESFIAPAIIRKLFDEIYFYCLQENDFVFDEIFHRKYSIKIRKYKNIKSLVKSLSGKEFCLDIDMDVFFDLEGSIYSDLWSNKCIAILLDSIQLLSKCASLTTIAMSFDYINDVDKTKKITKTLLDKLQIPS